MISAKEQNNQAIEAVLRAMKEPRLKGDLDELAEAQAA